MTPTPPSSAQLRDQACQSVIDSNPAEAYSNKDFTDGSLYWAFSMNFETFDPNDGEPLGCLRIFGRDTVTEHTFVPVDGGGLLVDTCRAIGNMGFSSITLAHTSLGTPTQNVTTGRATFDGRSHIECEIDIGSLAKLAMDSNLANLSLAQGDVDGIWEDIRVMTTTRYHPYKTFAIIVAGAVHAINNVANPVVYYRPLSGQRGSASMSLPAIIDDDFGTVSATLGQPEPVYSPPLQPRPTELPMPECYHGHEEMNYWWTNLDVSGADPQGDRDTLTFTIRRIAQNSPVYNKPCTRVAPTPTPRQINFWTGPSVLYIGCRPDENGDCRSWLLGDLYGVVIDPTDSKPQSD